MTEADLAAALRGHRILLAYGLLGELMQRFRRLGLDYMGRQLAWLQSLPGCTAQVIALPTAAPVQANAAALATAIVADPRPVLLIGHSKGGVEGLAALLQPEAAARCRGFLALQSPFLGSPLADAVAAARPLHGMAALAVRALKLGTGEGLRDLTTGARAAWMTQHEAALAALAARLPILTVATMVTPDCPPADRRVMPLVRWMERRAGPNDGLVPVASALLPGAMQVVLPGAHRALVSMAPGRDPVGRLGMLLGRLLSLPPPPPAPAPHPPPP